MPSGSKPGERRGPGRKGIPNKATVERMLVAQKAIDAARNGEVAALGKDVLERMMKLCEGAAGVHRPTTQAEIAAGMPKSGDWPLFGQWIDRTIYCARELAKYQSPTFKAIAVAAVPPQDLPSPRSEGGNVVMLNDPVAMQRVYRNMIAGGRR